MTPKSHELPSQSQFPHAKAVEQVLGVPLLLEKIDTDYVPPNREDVRMSAYAYVLRAAADVAGSDLHMHAEPRPFSNSEVAALHELDDMQYLNREVRIANHIWRANARRLRLPGRADDPGTPRARFQRSLLGVVVSHFQTFPTGVKYKPTDDLRYRINDGLALIAPTGSGKTPMEAIALRLMGLDQPDEDQFEDDRAVLVTSTEKLVQQFLGESGNNTFREFLGEDVSVTPYYGLKKVRALGKAVITTTRSVERLNPRDFTRFVIDEGHNGLSKKMLELIGGFGIRPLLATATPAYNQRRDLRNIFNHIETRTTRQLIEEGVLNRVRVLTFLYDKNGSVELMAAKIAVTYLQNNRRLVVYCQPGGESKQARQVAQLINELYNEDRVKAGHAPIKVVDSVGTHVKHQNAAIEKRFDSKKLNGLTTCRRLGEGWDPIDLPVGIFIGPSPELDLQQRFGRILRPGEHISEAVELLNREKPGTSLWQILGLDAIHSAVIGPLEGLDDYYGDTATRPRDAESRPRNKNEVVPLEAFPQEIRDSLLPDQPLRSVTVDGKFVQQPPKSYKQLEWLAGQHNVPPRWLQIFLDEQEFKYTGIRGAPQPDGTTYARYYEPAAEQYLAANPIPELANFNQMTRESIATLLATTTPNVDRIINKLRLQSTPALIPVRHHTNEHLGLSEIISIMIELEDELPIADETDVPVGQLYEECGRNFVVAFIGTPGVPNNNLAPKEKRRNIIHGLKGVCVHLSEADANRVRQARSEFVEAAVADPKLHISFRDAAKAAELSYDSFANQLTEAEEALSKTMRKRTGSSSGLSGRYFLRSEVEPIIERLKPKGLPAHLVSSAIFGARTPSLPTKSARWLRENNQEAVMMRLRGGGIRETPCLTWEQLRLAESQLKKADGLQPINYNRVVRDEYDRDPERLKYSRYIQQLYVGKDMLDFSPPKWRPEPSKPESVPQLAIKKPEIIQPPEPEREARPITAKERRALVAASRGPKQKPRAQQTSPPAAVSAIIPDNYVNLREYLANQNAACAAPIIKRLIRDNKLPAVLEDRNKELWGSEETALGLEAAIVGRFEVAEAGMARAEDIAAEYAQHGIQVQHIVHVASSLVDSLAEHVLVRQSLLPDGEIGPLDLHYSSTLTQRIRDHLAKLHSRGQLGQLLRFAKVNRI